MTLISDEEVEMCNGIDVPDLGGSTATMILHPNKCQSKVGGRTLKHSEQPHKVNAAPAAVEKSWEDCSDKLITECTDFELTEFLIGRSTELLLDEGYWPGDKGSWLVECVDSGMYRNNPTIECTLISGPHRPAEDETVTVFVNTVGGKDFSIHRAIAETYPLAVTCSDFQKEQAHWLRVFEEKTVSKAKVMCAKMSNLARCQITKFPAHAFLLITSLDQIAWVVSTKLCKGLESPLSSPPKNQRDAHL